MIYRALLATLVAGAILVVPVKAQLQTPLRTLCLTSAMEYCLSIYTWEWEYLTPEEDRVLDGYGTVRQDATVRYFGSALEGWGPDYTTLFVTDTDGDDFNALARGAGLHEGVGDTSLSRLNYWVPDVHRDIRWVGFGWGTIPTPPPFVAGCSALGGQPPFSMPTCHEVPEPGPLVLVLSGVLGLAWIGRVRAA